MINLYFKMDSALIMGAVMALIISVISVKLGITLISINSVMFKIVISINKVSVYYVRVGIY